MLQYFLGWWNLKWTRSQSLFHPLPDHVSRNYVSTPLGLLELLVSQSQHHSPERPPVLFVHGGLGHASVWLEWMTYLSQHYPARVYAVSVRNHGASYVCSSWFRMVYQTKLDDVVSDVATAINEVAKREGTPPVLVAHSAGGGVLQFTLMNGMAKTPGLVLAGAVPHFGFMSPLWNWLTRIDWWMFLRGFLMLHHPRSALSTTVLVRNAFFGPDYPYDRVQEFEKWMAPYESVRWPADMMGSWQGGKNVWLDPLKIVRNITTDDDSKDRVLILMGSEDKMMQGTQSRSVAEYSEAIRQLDLDTKVQIVGDRKRSGVRLMEIDRAGHHLQNDVQWEDGAKALLEFLLQL